MREGMPHGYEVKQFKTKGRDPKKEAVRKRECRSCGYTSGHAPTCFYYTKIMREADERRGDVITAKPIDEELMQRFPDLGNVKANVAQLDEQSLARLERIIDTFDKSTHNASAAEIVKVTRVFTEQAMNVFIEASKVRKSQPPQEQPPTTAAA